MIVAKVDFVLAILPRLQSVDVCGIRYFIVSEEERAFRIEQYKALRAEVLQSTQLQASFFQVGLTIITLILVGSVRFIDTDEGHFFVNLLLVPFLCYGFSMLWASEHRRMRRAGSYIGQLEENLTGNRESWTKYKREHSSEKSLLTTRTIKLTIFITLGATSVFFGYAQVSEIAPRTSFLILAYNAFLLVFGIVMSRSLANSV